jgi:hypothetical protein
MAPHGTIGRRMIGIRNSSEADPSPPAPLPQRRARGDFVRVSSAPVPIRATRELVEVACPLPPGGRQEASINGSAVGCAARRRPALPSWVSVITGFRLLVRRSLSAEASDNQQRRSAAAATVGKRRDRGRGPGRLRRGRAGGAGRGRRGRAGASGGRNCGES